jgi:hypothetical protein
LNCLAIVYDKKNNEEINKINEFCRYENVAIDYYMGKIDFKKIFDFIIKNNISKVFLSDASVLDNDLNSFTEKIIALHKNNISVLCASYDFPDPFQLAIRTLSMNGKDPGRINRIKDSINKKASRGQVLGKIPYGYKKNPSGFFEEDLSQSKNVKKIFSLYNQHVSISEISKELQNTLWTEKWSNQKVKHILKNDFYTGIYRRYNVVIPNSHISIINKKDFDNANKKLDIDDKRSYIRNFWSRFLFCKLCLNKLSITNHKNSWISKGQRKSKNYKYYICNHKKYENEFPQTLKIKYEKLNDLLEENINKEFIIEKKFEDSYVYKLISKLTTSKIRFDEFIEKFENYKKISLKKKDMIEKIFIKQVDDEIFISST